MASALRKVAKGNAPQAVGLEDGSKIFTETGDEGGPGVAMPRASAPKADGRAKRGLTAFLMLGVATVAVVAAIYGVKAVWPTEKVDRGLEIASRGVAVAEKGIEVAGRAKEKIAEVKEAAKGKLAEAAAKRQALVAERGANEADDKAALAATGSGYLLKMYHPSAEQASPDAHLQGKVAIPTRWTVVGADPDSLPKEMSTEEGIALAILERAAGGVPAGFKMGDFRPAMFGAAVGAGAISPCLAAGLTCLYFPSIVTERAKGDAVEARDLVIGMPPLMASVPKPRTDEERRAWTAAMLERMEADVVNRAAVGFGRGAIDTATWVSPYEDVVLVQTRGGTVSRKGHAVPLKMSVMAACDPQECRPFAMLPVSDFSPAQRVVEVRQAVGKLGGVYVVTPDSDSGDAKGHLTDRQWSQAVFRAIEISSFGSGWKLKGELDRVQDALGGAAAAIAGGASLSELVSKYAHEASASNVAWLEAERFEFRQRGLSHPSLPIEFTVPQQVGADTFRIVWTFVHERLPGGGLMELPHFKGTLTFKVTPLGPGAYVELVDEQVSKVDVAKGRVYLPRGY